MFYSLLDLMVCPACKHSLTVLAPQEQPQRTTMRMKWAQCACPQEAVVGPLPSPAEETQLCRLLAPLGALPAADGRDREVSVVHGVLVCIHCERWYPIRVSLPEMLPDHLWRWDEEREWLMARQTNLAVVGLIVVWEVLLARTGPGLVAPFYPSQPHLSLDLLARYVKTVSRLDCGINGMVLDLGVGYAWTTEWLARPGYRAVGVDITRDYLLAGLSRMGANVPHLIVADNENLPLRDECVGAVLSIDAFHHLPNLRRAMMELARILRRLRLKDLIARVEGTHRYILTTYGRRVASLMTKLRQRIFAVASAALETTAEVPSKLARAFCQLDEEMRKLVAEAQLALAKS